MAIPDLDQLVAYYQFDEASDNIINLATSVGSTDSFGADADLAPAGTPVFSASGLIDDAVDYDDDGDYSEADVDISSLSYPFSVNVWVRPPSGSADASQVFSFVDKSEGGVMYGVSMVVDGSDLDPRLFARNTTFRSVNGSAMTHDGSTWTMMTGVFLSDTSKKLYVNATEEAELTTSVTLGAGIDRISVGRIGDSSPSANANTAVDELSFWNRELTEAEMSDLYNGGSGLSLVAATEGNFTLSGTHATVLLDKKKKRRDSPPILVVPRAEQLIPVEFTFLTKLAVVRFIIETVKIRATLVREANVKLDLKSALTRTVSGKVGIASTLLQKISHVAGLEGNTLKSYSARTDKLKQFLLHKLGEINHNG